MTERVKQEAIQFFAENAGYSQRPDETDAAARLRSGTDLANAEAEAASRGWFVIWSIDRDAGRRRGRPQWKAVLYDRGGGIRASLCGIDFSEDYSGYETGPQTDYYARVVAAELADEALAELRNNKKGN
jgi:hypothetical protein